uniref:Uncharacterized protein n=1 Tax=Ixodes ricinus TaxID=34613 RepID=A0A131Y602_IXORI
MSSESSSDEDEKNRFLEAAVTAKDVFSRKSGDAETQGSSQKAGNARPLDISEDCQKYLAKSLQKTLDRKLKEVEVEADCYEPDSSSGIKLFSDSSIELNDVQEDRHVQCPRKRPKLPPKISDDMLAAVAVTPDWVLKHSGIVKHSDDATKCKKSKNTSDT